MASPVVKMDEESSKHNMHSSFSTLSPSDLDVLIEKYHIPLSLHPVLPEPNVSIFSLQDGKIGIYADMFRFGNYRLPFTKFLIRALSYFGVHISQMHPQGLSRLSHFEVSSRAVGVSPSIVLFRAFYRITMAGDWYTFERRRGVSRLSTTLPPNPRSWKNQFFYVDDRCIPPTMRWREIDDIVHDVIPEESEYPKVNFDRLVSVASPIRELPECILLVSRISKAWFEPELWPILQYHQREMELYNALGLKSFSGLELSAEKIDETTVPFLDQTSSSFYEIRPEAETMDVDGTSVNEGNQETLSIEDMYDRIVGSKTEEAPSATSSQLKVLLMNDMSEKERDTASDVTATTTMSHVAKGKMLKRPPKPHTGKDVHKRKSPRLITQSPSKSTSGRLEVIDDDVMANTAETPVTPPYDKEFNISDFLLNSPDVTDQTLINTPLLQNIQPSSSVVAKTSSSSSLSQSFPLLGVPTSNWLKADIELVSMRTSSAKEFSHASATELFIPKWDVLSSQSCKDPSVAKKLSLLSSTPTDVSSVHQVPHEVFSNEFMTSHAKQQNLVADLYERWVIAEAKVEELAESQKRHMLSKLNSNSIDVQVKTNTLLGEVESLKMHNRKLIALEQEAKRNLKQAQDNELVLKNQFLEERNKLEESVNDVKKEVERLEETMKAMTAEREVLQSENKTLKDKSKWLIAEGLGLLAKRVHSEVIPMALSLNQAVNAVGFNEGIKCGLAHASKNEMDINSFKEYDASARDKVLDRLKSLQSMTFNIIEQVSQLDVSDVEKMKEMLKPVNSSKPTSSSGN
ncbi:hypothetical protein SSX86_000040 [Deinandra increscens subsp. villosa]|uniref:Transposase (putative) gypsy type domain-containing protein n=1 Tax=Deinandra increscens subsp. villosa TaxID=3103831 RepID=A0AAP0DX74_9ASTR